MGELSGANPPGTCCLKNNTKNINIRISPKYIIEKVLPGKNRPNTCSPEYLHVGIRNTLIQRNTTILRYRNSVAVEFLNFENDQKLSLENTQARYQINVVVQNIFSHYSFSNLSGCN